MAQFDGLSEFRKSGPSRLRDAEELLQRPTNAPNEAGAESRHLRGAMYLAGYGVECLIKARIIQEAGELRLSAAIIKLDKANKVVGRPSIAIISTSAGHNIQLLLSFTSLANDLSEDKKKQLGICAKWKSNWRYDPTPATEKEAVEFVTTARSVVNWLKTQI